MQKYTTQKAVERYHDKKPCSAEITMTSDVQRNQAHDHKLLLCKVAEHRDRQAFEELFDFYAPKIRSFGVQRLGQQGLALDLLQETMTSVWTKAHMFNADKGSVNTWVFTIMRNQCFDMLRRVQHNREDAYGDDIWPLFEDADAGDGMGDHKMSARLLENMDKLPPLQKQIVQGVYLQELSQHELAVRLGIPVGTVKSRLRLGLEKLRSYLEHDHD